jgi:polyisoprenoid-binding protein YceI
MSVTQSDGTTVATTPGAGTYAIDASHTGVGFKVRHLMVSKVRGNFTDFAGTVTIAEDPLQSSAEVTVQLASIDTRDEQRDAHLRGGDFFDIEANPTMTFRSTGVRPVGGNRYEVDGELTLLGTTLPIVLHTEYEGTSRSPWGATSIGFSAKGELDREDFGLTWNQALETGGVLVGRKVELELEVEAVRQD